MTLWLLGFALAVAQPPLPTDAVARSLGPPWKELAPGVVTATVADLGGDANWAAKVVLADPQRATFAVRYDPSRPTLAAWRARYPNALAIANGSFYSTDGPPGAEVRPTCDVISAGRQVRGAGCHRQDALFFAASAATSKSSPPASTVKAGPQILAPADFHAADWAEALKSFPALVHGSTATCSGVHYCAESSRTAAVAQLRDGRILLFASQWPAVRREVGKWLADELGAVEALNLDGGPEATLSLRGEPLEDSIGSQGVGLPMVIVLLPLAGGR